MTDNRAVQPEAPTTEAGRRLLEDFFGDGMILEPLEAILAIEAEARAASQERPQPEDEVIFDGVMAHKASECQWRPSRSYPGSDACLVNGAAHYRTTAVAQERPPMATPSHAPQVIDVERLAQSVHVALEHHGNDDVTECVAGFLDHKYAVVIATEYARLAGASVEGEASSPVQSDD